MTTFTPAAAAPSSSAKPQARRGMDPGRRAALAAGVLYLITFAASIPQLGLFATVVRDPEGFVTGAGSTGSVLVGSWLEVITAFAGIGTAVALYPITRRFSRTAAIGFVTSRVAECSMILVGVVCMLAVVTLRQDLVGATGARDESLRVTAHALVAVRQWTFLVGPGIIAGINGLFLASVMYRARLVPRLIPTIGLIGAPIILISATGTFFGLWAQVSAPAFALGLPIAVWELSLGIYLAFIGFRPVDGLGASSPTQLPG